MIKTIYGKIPNNELIIEKIPDRPIKYIPNYLKALVLEEIDNKTSYIQVKNVRDFNDTLSLKSVINQPSSELNRVYKRNISFKTKPSNKLFTLPKVLSPKLAYFIGYFSADGALKDIFKSLKTSGHYDYKFKVGDEFLMQTLIIQNIFGDLFNFKPPIRTERILKGENYYYIELASKVVYRYLTTVFEFPCGSKIETLKIPELIQKAPKELRKWFVRGFFDADGGVKTMEQYNTKPIGNYIYLNIRAYNFEKQIIEFLKKDFGAQFFKPSLNKKDNAWKTGTSAKENIIKLYKQKIFIHPIKRWRLAKLVKLL